MSIESRIDGVNRLLQRIRDYKRMIEADSFEPATVEDMKGNAKAMCDQAKDELDEIKNEIDSWE
ncbi:hypothetical protein ES703_62180 [subsurface metagenome]